MERRELLGFRCHNQDASSGTKVVPCQGGSVREHIVDVSHVNKSFNGTRVVDDVSFCIEQGEVFGMVGPNGAGKTTTIRILMDIVKPD